MIRRAVLVSAAILLSTPRLHAQSPFDGLKFRSVGPAVMGGRVQAIAVDPSQHAMGGLYWIDASAPKLAGAFPTYRRAVVALDTGGAIKGQKIDLYTGNGRGSMAQARRLNMRTLTIADAGRFDGCPPAWTTASN